MLDDSIMMAKRLRGNGVDVQIDLLDGLAHGFLNFVLVSHDAKHGSNLCMQVGSWRTEGGAGWVL